MIQEFISTLTITQAFTVSYLCVYMIMHGICYHLTAIVCLIKSKRLKTNTTGHVMNVLGYLAILNCMYWWV